MMEFVDAPTLAKMPVKPKNAEWAKEARITDRFKHEADGSGYIKPGFRHIYIISVQGGVARKLTSGNRNYGGALQWSPDGRHIYFSGNLNEDWDYDFRNSEIYKVDTQTGEATPLTQRKGPDRSMQVSPDGSKIAYLGFDDKVQSYQVTRLYVINANGSGKHEIVTGLDRSISSLQWLSDGQSLYFMYDDKGNSKLGLTTLDGQVLKLLDDIGGTTLGRPYASGSYTVSNSGTIAFTHSKPSRPAELAIYRASDGTPKVLTNLGGELLAKRTMGKVEELWYKSSVDGRDIQGWVVYPPDYQTGKTYPLLVENHGGPILNYGDRFSAEIQLYAAAGYVVFYPNPRGSTSYGEEFGNLLYNNYPGEDYNDVMDGVDVCIAKGLASEDQLFVTGGSAGGIMTAWMIGKNNRFKAAVVAKPVMNWLSKTLVADNYYGYANSRYPGQPWENFEGYWKFSPISLVGNIETPTMVMVGMNDLRTPPSEAKQLYHALKIRKKETMLVEIPGASHGIASRPSNLIAKVLHTLAWMEKFRKE
jgi:dipeptidyl aminopeptidase/acylaminoacyl peptidase